MGKEMMRNVFVTVLAGAIVSVFVSANASAAGDPAAGKQIFQKCALCHSPQKGVNKVGPSLWGVVGRPSASITTYDYSPALKKTHWTWTPAKLDQWLQGPSKLVPGTKMIFPGLPTVQERSDVIAYLATLK